MNDHAAKQQFLNHYQQDKFGDNFQNIPLDKQMRFNKGLLTRVNNNPNAAGHMLNEFRSNEDAGRDNPS